MNDNRFHKYQLIKNLTQFLSDEYVKNISKKEALIQRKYELEEERLTIQHSSTTSDMMRMKQLFSPLSFESDSQMEEPKEIKEIGKKITEIEEDIKKIEQKSDEIKTYIQGLKKL